MEETGVPGPELLVGLFEAGWPVRKGLFKLAVVGGVGSAVERLDKFVCERFWKTESRDFGGEEGAGSRKEWVGETC